MPIAILKILQICIKTITKTIPSVYGDNEILSCSSVHILLEVDAVLNAMLIVSQFYPSPFDLSLLFSELITFVSRSQNLRKSPRYICEEKRPEENLADFLSDYLRDYLSDYLNDDLSKKSLSCDGTVSTRMSLFWWPQQ